MTGSDNAPARMVVARLSGLVRLAAVAFLVLFGSASASARAQPKPSGRKPKSSDTISTLMVGAVLADTGDIPIADAEVWFPTLKRSIRTDSLGHYQVAGLPMGDHLLVVRRLGFEAISATVTVRTTEPMPVDFFLAPISIRLASMVVTASNRSRRLSEFESRRKFGAGRFLTEDFFRKNVNRTLGDILRSQLSGVRTLGSGSAQFVVSTRDGAPCPVQVIVDGMSTYNGTGGQLAFDINSIQTMNVIGLEYYTVASTPVQFNTTSGRGGSVCGTLVVWTK